MLKEWKGKVFYSELKELLLHLSWSLWAPLGLAAAWAALPVLLEAWGDTGLQPPLWQLKYCQKQKASDHLSTCWSGAGASHWENLARIQWARKSGKRRTFCLLFFKRRIQKSAFGWYIFVFSPSQTRCSLFGETVVGSGKSSMEKSIGSFEHDVYSQIVCPSF